MVDIKTIMWSGNAISGANPGATFVLVPDPKFTVTGRLNRVWMKGNSTAGSIYFFESGTDIALATMTAGSNIADSSNPRVIIQDSAGTAASAGDNLYDRYTLHNPVYLTGSGFTSGTSNKLGTIVLEYE